MKVGPLFIFSVFRYCTRLSAELERFYPADIYEKRGFMLARPNRKIATLSTEFSRRKIFFFPPLSLQFFGYQESQLPGRLFSPSDISKKLSHHFLLHFPIGVGSYDHHAKYQGVFMDLK